MEAAHLGSGNRICTVVFADIVQYAEESVSRQVEMKAAFSVILATALEHTPAADRVVLDTGDGAALCFLGDPEDALFAANSLRSGVIEGPEPEARPAATPRDQPGAGARRERHQRAQQRHRRRHQRGPAGHELRRAEPDPRLPLLLRGRVAARPRLRPALPVRGLSTATSTCASTRSMRCTWRRRLAARRGAGGQRRVPAADSPIHAAGSGWAHRPARPGVRRAAGVGARAGDRAGGEADCPARGRACRRRGRARGRRGRARARREPRQLSRPSVGPAGGAARPAAVPAGAGHRGAGSAGTAGAAGDETGPEDWTRGPRAGREDADGPDRAGGDASSCAERPRRPRARAISSRASPGTSTTPRSGRSSSPRPTGSERRPVSA